MTFPVALTLVPAVTLGVNLVQHVRLFDLSSDLQVTLFDEVELTSDAVHCPTFLLTTLFDLVEIMTLTLEYQPLLFVTLDPFHVIQIVTYFVTQIVVSVILSAVV